MNRKKIVLCLSLTATLLFFTACSGGNANFVSLGQGESGSSTTAAPTLAAQNDADDSATAAPTSAAQYVSDGSATAAPTSAAQYDSDDSATATPTSAAQYDSDDSATAAPTSAAQYDSDPLSTDSQGQTDNTIVTVSYEVSKCGTSIQLSDNGIRVIGEGVQVSGNRATITAAGSYLISGSMSDGQLLVNTTDEAAVTLVLNGVDLTCSDSAPLHILQSPKKTVLYLVAGTTNRFTDSDSYTAAVDETITDAPTACIFSMDDLEISGEGTLLVSGLYNKGIFTKDDLRIKDGVITVTAVDDGVRGKDSVTLSGGTLTITAGADGLRASNDTNSEKGNITITGGTLTITAEQDAIQAITDLTVTGGTLSLTCGGGAANSSKTSETWGDWGGGRGGMGNMGGGSMTTNEADDTTSAKAMKSDQTITITGGDITIDSSDDSLHAASTILITGGNLYAESGDDGIHCDDILTIEGGTVTIAKSYEGLEAVTLNINGGEIRVTASDDGLNAAGGADGSSTNGRRGMGMFSSSTGSLYIRGGYLVVNANGDGLDSNGSIEMSGGTVLVYGPTSSGNGALDYDGTFTLTGGTLLALGSSGMAQSVSSSTQPVLAFTISGSANALLHIADAGGNELLTVSPQKSYSCVVFTSPALVSGEAYTISTGGSYSGEVNDGLCTSGSYSGGTVAGSLNAS